MTFLKSQIDYGVATRRSFWRVFRLSLPFRQWPEAPTRKKLAIYDRVQAFDNHAAGRRHSAKLSPVSRRNARVNARRLIANS
jgi:hypothetical protein